jgi:hypothetical protein
VVIAHPLDGSRWKVQIAGEHIEALSYDIFFNRHIGRARIDFQKFRGEAEGHQLEPLVEVETRRYWPVLIGEIAYDLRSALDQLICQLAIRGRGDGPLLQLTARG